MFLGKQPRLTKAINITRSITEFQEQGLLSPNTTCFVGTFKIIFIFQEAWCAATGYTTLFFYLSVLIPALRIKNWGGLVGWLNSLVISIFCHDLEKVVTGLFILISIDRADSILFTIITPIMDPFAMAHAEKQIPFKERNGPGSSVDQPAEMEQLNSCRNLLAADESYIL